MGAIKAIFEKKLNIPRDVGLVSFDNYPIAELLEPTLTTVDIDVYEMGVEAAKLLMRLIETPSARHQNSLISTSIQVRESSVKSVISEKSLVSIVSEKSVISGKSTESEK
jgi:LacI family transcriptional regulator